MDCSSGALEVRWGPDQELTYFKTTLLCLIGVNSWGALPRLRGTEAARHRTAGICDYPNTSVLGRARLANCLGWLTFG